MYRQCSEHDRHPFYLIRLGQHAYISLKQVFRCQVVTVAAEEDGQVWVVGFSEKVMLF
jgi:hypothetical protein